MALRVVFMGTPNFAAAILRQLAAAERVQVLAVYTQPDRPAGRGNKIQAPPAKILAQNLGLPVNQPSSFNDQAVRAELASLQPDILAVAAYGLILPQAVLDIPRLGPFNVHASLLPKYRGAAPIQRALINGETISGVTIMRMEAGLDTGPILLQEAVRIDPADTADSLFALLAENGARLLLGALRILEENRAAYTPQNSTLASLAPKLGPAEENIDWRQNAASIHNLIRGLHSKPGARSRLDLGSDQPLPVRLAPGAWLAETSPLPPGSLWGFDGHSLKVACGQGAYLLNQLQPAGKNLMSAKDFYNGRLRNRPAPYARFLAPA